MSSGRKQLDLLEEPKMPLPHCILYWAVLTSPTRLLASITRWLEFVTFDLASPAGKVH